MKRVPLKGLLLACFVVSLPAGSTQKEEPLDQSFDLSQNLSRREQLSYLIDLCHVTSQLNLSAEKVKEYSLTLYSSASKEQDAVWRVVGQKEAVRCLSYVDSAGAMELLPKVNFQRPALGQFTLEDPRYNAAETTFNNLLDSFAGKIAPEGVADIISKARYLGQTGQYPYVAAARVMNRLPASFRNETNTLLRDALEFYAAENGFYNRDEEFSRLLQSITTPYVDNALVVQALTSFVQRLKTAPINFPGDYYEEVHIASSGKVFPFTDRNAAFLFRTFPTILRFDPTFAAQLRQKDPKLGEATNDMRSIYGGFVQGDPTSEQATQQHLRLLQRSLLRRIRERQDCNPQAALGLAQRLTDLSSRVVGFSAAIPGIARTDFTQARILYEKQLSDLGNLGDDISRLRAMVALVPPAYHLGELNEYQSLSEQAFDMGVRVLNGSDNGTEPQGREGFAELQDLVTFTASQAADPLWQRVQSLPDDWLKTYLLLYEAVGRARIKAPPGAAGPCPT